LANPLDGISIPAGRSPGEGGRFDPVSSFACPARRPTLSLAETASSRRDPPERRAPTALVAIDQQLSLRSIRPRRPRFADVDCAGPTGGKPLNQEQSARASRATSSRVRLIATEEACNIPEVAAALRDVARAGGHSLDLKLVAGIYDAPPEASGGLFGRLLDIEQERLRDMDANGVDMQLLGLTAPGVQMFEPRLATELASLANDRLAAVVQRHPKRFAALATFAPQDPAAAVREMERAITRLRLNGFIINSHTNNEYLDQQKYWPILEAIEALGVPLYIHPRAPSDGMAAPFRDYRLDAAVWGYGVEVGTHVVRLMMSGALDRFEKLKIVIGHMGEAIPFWLWRLDYMGNPARGRSPQKLRPSEYFRRNFAITTSGVEDPLALRYCIDRLGVDSVMWAIDYPYQPSAPAVEFIRNAPLSDEEREKVCHGNAERIFGIAPEAEGY
jgi:5-carboxyvanillate decarboxylase